MYLDMYMRLIDALGRQPLKGLTVRVGCLACDDNSEAGPFRELIFPSMSLTPELATNTGLNTRSIDREALSTMIPSCRCGGRGSVGCEPRR